MHLQHALRPLLTRQPVAVLSVLVVILAFDNGNAYMTPTIQKPMKDESAEVILEIERTLFTAIRKKDTETLSRIVAEDFVFRGPGQKEMGKAEFLKSVQSFPIEIVNIWGDDMKVSIFGDVALLTGVQKAVTRRKNGNDEISAGAFSDLFVKRGGRWMLVVAYNVELPPVQPINDALVSATEGEQ